MAVIDDETNENGDLTYKEPVVDIRRILYCVVSKRPVQIVAQFLAAGVTGNFEDIAKHVLPAIPREDDTKQSSPYDKWALHYKAQDDLIYFCMADNTVYPRICFQFLEDVAKLFEQAYGDRSRLPNFEAGGFKLLNFYNEQMCVADFESGSLQRPTDNQLEHFSSLEGKAVKTVKPLSSPDVASLENANQFAPKTYSLFELLGTPQGKAVSLALVVLAVGLYSQFFLGDWI